MDTTARYPRSAHDPTDGLLYFARMLDKIRMHASGSLPAPYHEYLGAGFDGRCCRFLGVGYPALRERVLAGGTDAEILAWCRGCGHSPTEEEIGVWNTYARKRGWRDDDGGSAALEKHKAASGLAHREDLVTFFDYYDVDEGRKP